MHQGPFNWRYVGGANGLIDYQAMHFQKHLCLAISQVLTLQS